MQDITLENSTRWFYTLSVVLFFFNTALPGGGLSLVLLLTPVWIYLAQKQYAGLNRGIIITCAVLAIYFLLHLYSGIDSIYYYLRSTFLLISLLFFINALVYYLKEQAVVLDWLFRNLLIVNFVLCLVSLVLLFVPVLKPLVWYIMSISYTIEPIPRLKLFTPEASHYAFSIAPLFIYFIVRAVFSKTEKPHLMLIMAILPMMLSFSLGVIAALGIAAGIIFLAKYVSWFSHTFPPGKIIKISLLGLVLLTVVYLVYPDNPLYVRIQNLFLGYDTSGRGRTYEAFILADKVAAVKNMVWGIGPGQLKLIGRDIIVQYYNYSKIPEVIRIPNATAETLAWFGYSGLLLRVLLQVFLFFRTRVAENPFRLWLFCFLFIYQFTGSYITNAMEYAYWILAFTPVFDDLNLKRKAMT